MDKMEKSSGLNLSYQEKEKLIRALLTDFQLGKAWEIKQKLHNLPDQEVKPIGLKVSDFIDYEDKYGNFQAPLLDYLIYILKFIKILCNKNMLTNIPSPGLPWIDEVYTSILAPQKESYWNLITTYADLLGIDYIYEKIKRYEAHIEVINSDGDYHGGSGTLIAPGIILTCKHVVDPEKFRISKVELSNRFYNILDVKVSKDKDIAIVYINDCDLDPKNDIILGKGNVMEQIITFGYPAIPMLRESPLIVQKGEINAITRDFHNKECLIISSIVRPGNSGGAIISENGLYVGMVADFKERHSLEDKILLDESLEIKEQIQSLCEQINGQPQLVPFYSGISTTELIEEINNLDNTIKLTIVG